ncbi:MAG TPA: hypothetical protein VFX12_15525 [Vicinamibacterales bacterium]|nr:hypothetical protein [Vicinamibacterales bacterium]
MDRTGRAKVVLVSAAIGATALTAWAQSGAPAPSGADAAGAATVAIDKPMPPPAWAFAERALLRLDAEGAQQYAATHFDERGYSKAPIEWGVGSGPDDIVEALRSWPLAYALGAPDSILEDWHRLWEGHLQQYDAAKIPEVEAARDGVYYHEFMSQFDWEHNGEGLAGFYFYGLDRPDDAAHVDRARRFAGLYMNEDPEAPNYDPQHKIIKSLFNGSRGPKLTPATVDEWDGPLPAGVSPTAARRTRFVNSSNIRGDHPLNLSVVMMVANTYLLTHEQKYRDWVLEYVNAWRDRIAKNGGNIPSNIGLDGTIGGEWGGKWYGGVFGWNSPDGGVRNYVFRGPPEAFTSAFLLTADPSYLAVMRRQLDNLYAAKKIDPKNGRIQLPRYYGDKGWYGYDDAFGAGPSGGLGNLANVIVDLAMWSQDPHDLARVPKTGWLGWPPPPPPNGDTATYPENWFGYLQSGNPDYPLKALQEELDVVRRAALRGTRGRGRGARGGGAQGARPVAGRGAPGVARGGRGRGRGRGGAPGGGTGTVESPVATTALVNLTMGASDPGGSTHGAQPINAQLRYFDPEHRRAGLPEDVGALIERIRPDGVTVTLVNLNPVAARTVLVQTGAYAEHAAVSVTLDGHTIPVNASSFTVRLAPGAGGQLVVAMKRDVNQPTLALPWNRSSSGTH